MDARTKALIETIDHAGYSVMARVDSDRNRAVETTYKTTPT